VYISQPKLRSEKFDNNNNNNKIIVQYFRKMGILWGSTSAIICHQKVYDSVRRGVLYNILIQFAVPIHLVRLIKMCFSDTYIKSS